MSDDERPPDPLEGDEPEDEEDSPSSKIVTPFWRGRSLASPGGATKRLQRAYGGDVTRLHARRDEMARVLTGSRATLGTLERQSLDLVTHPDAAHPELPSAVRRERRDLETYTRELDKAYDELLQQTRWVERVYGDPERWLREAEELQGEFEIAYEGLGPQYTVIIDALVRSVIRMRQMCEPTYVDAPAREWHLTVRQVQDLVNQLQKFTESQKHELVEVEVQKGMLKIIQIVEGVVGPRHPQLMQEIVHTIETKVQEAGG